MSEKAGYGASGFVSMVPLPQVVPLIGGCQYIEGDPLELLRRKIDPYCGKPRKDGSSYCAEHHKICWLRAKRH